MLPPSGSPVSPTKTQPPANGYQLTFEDGVEINKLYDRYLMRARQSFYTEINPVEQAFMNAVDELGGIYCSINPTGMLRSDVMKICEGEGKNHLRSVYRWDVCKPLSLGLTKYYFKRKQQGADLRGEEHGNNERTSLEKLTDRYLKNVFDFVHGRGADEPFMADVESHTYTEDKRGFRQAIVHNMLKNDGVYDVKKDLADNVRNMLAAKDRADQATESLERLTARYITNVMNFVNGHSSDEKFMAAVEKYEPQIGDSKNYRRGLFITLSTNGEYDDGKPLPVHVKNMLAAKHQADQVERDKIVQLENRLTPDYAAIAKDKDESFRYFNHKSDAAIRCLWKLWKSNKHLIGVFADITPSLSFPTIWKNYLEVVKNDMTYAFNFAKIIGERFTEGEAAIAEDGTTSLRYAKEVVEGRFLAGEPAINKLSPFSKYDYVDLIAGSLTPREAFEYIKTYYSHFQPPKALELRIASDAGESYDYATYFLKRPFERGEDIIATNGSLAFSYARNVLHGAFPKGEKVIGESPTYAYLYAKDALKGRFFAAEKVIKEDSSCWKKYTELFGISTGLLSWPVIKLLVMMVTCLTIFMSMFILARGGSPTMSVLGMLSGVLGVGIILTKYIKKKPPTLT